MFYYKFTTVCFKIPSINSWYISQISSDLQLKVPLPSIDTVGFLCSEDAEPLSRHVVQVRLSCWMGGGRGGTERKDKLWKNILYFVLLCKWGGHFCKCNDTMKSRHGTMVLVRSLQVVSISKQSPDSLSQTVLVGLLGSLVQQNVGDQTGISTTLHILTSSRGQRNTGNHQLHCTKIKPTSWIQTLPSCTGDLEPVCVVVIVLSEQLVHVPFVKYGGVGVYDLYCSQTPGGHPDVLATLLRAVMSSIFISSQCTYLTLCSLLPVGCHRSSPAGCGLLPRRCVHSQPVCPPWLPGWRSVWCDPVPEEQAYNHRTTHSCTDRVEALKR